MNYLSSIKVKYYAYHKKAENQEKNFFLLHFFHTLIDVQK